MRGQEEGRRWAFLLISLGFRQPLQGCLCPSIILAHPRQPRVQSFGNTMFSLIPPAPRVAGASWWVASPSLLALSVLPVHLPLVYSPKNFLWTHWHGFCHLDQNLAHKTLLSSSLHMKNLKSVSHQRDYYILDTMLNTSCIVFHLIFTKGRLLFLFHR